MYKSFINILYTSNIAEVPISGLLDTVLTPFVQSRIESASKSMYHVLHDL